MSSDECCPELCDSYEVQSPVGYLWYLVTVVLLQLKGCEAGPLATVRAATLGCEQAKACVVAQLLTCEGDPEAFVPGVRVGFDPKAFVSRVVRLDRDLCGTLSGGVVRAEPLLKCARCGATATPTEVLGNGAKCRVPRCSGTTMLPTGLAAIRNIAQAAAVVGALGLFEAANAAFEQLRVAEERALVAASPLATPASRASIVHPTLPSLEDEDEWEEATVG